MDIPTEERIVRVPFLDLAHSNADVADGVIEDLRELLLTSAFTNGPAVRQFEQHFARYCRTVDAIGVASGLDALRLALLGLDLEPGAEVIVPAMTFVATWEAVSQAGGVPIPVDVSEEDYGLNVDAAEAAVGDRTRVLLPVHLYGQMADMKSLLSVAERYDVPVLEDAAQAHGATRAGLRSGEGGRAAAFSFYPGKNLGAIGDAGALVTSDSRLAARIRALREHGQLRKYHHDEIGWTARLDTIQAAALLRKLPFLDSWNEERRTVADIYLDALRGVGDLVLPPVAESSVPVWHLFVVRTADPTGLVEHLKLNGVGAGRHYPEPPHLSHAYADLGFSEGSFPVAEAIARECLSLPIFPGMSESQALQVVESVVSWFDRG
jgi:dTDP-4-amino-4,6-dideoxygalactose transaminase